MVSRGICKAVLALAISAILPAVNVFAQTSESVSVFDIPAGKLSDALDSFMSQSDAQILYKSDLVAGKKSQALRGSMDRAAALTQLLSGTDLVWEKANGSTFVIKQTKAPLQKPDRPEGKASSATENDATSEPTMLDTIVVTGSRIRGGTSPSPVITIGAEQIREEGFTDLGEVIRNIPQNYAGGQNPGVNTASGIANQNITGGSALNLRGLGPDATLTLLNGRRLSYDGFVQAVDISAIPVEAVERIEIIPDGASAIYGSDAVGGVANVILKRDFDGVTLGTRYAGATGGGLKTHGYSATAGATWSTGGLIATWKKSSSDPIFASQRDYTESMVDPKTLYPGSDLRSGLLSVHQSLGDMVELRLDALKSHREQETYTGYSTYYYHRLPETSISLVSPSLEFSLPGDWSLTIGGAYGKDENVYKSSYVSSTASTLSSGCYCNESRSYEVGAEGPLFALGGGDARLAAGIGSRTDDFLVLSYTGTDRYGGEESARYAYAELNLPFISPASNITGIRRLEFSAAVRGEDYDSFGRVTTPKLGLVYDPSADFTLKASWGKSFKAPTLLQRYQDKASYLWSANQVGGSGYASDATVLMSYGGNAEDLEAERARTWTTSLSFHPEALPGLEAELTYFDIDYTGRIVQPISNISQILSDPSYSEFVSYSPTAEEQAALLAAYSDAFYNYAGAAYDPSKVVAIVIDQYINAARQRVKGLDLSSSYRFDIGNGLLTTRGTVSWLKSSQQNSAGQDAFDLAGTIFFPAKIKGRIGAVWTQGRFSASSFVNYTAGVTSTSATSTEKMASFTTVDATLRYDTGERDDALSGVEFVLSADNLFNRDPPFYAVSSISYVPYDSTNYSAIGRFLSFSVSKHW